MRTPVFLVGPRASGKTALGERLADAFGLVFVDVDREMLLASGLSVAEVVARDGWPGFRRREEEALRRAGAPGRVVATGGGAVLSAGNRAFMRESGTVLYLSAPAPVLAARMAADQDDGRRPSLTGKPALEEIEDVLRERECLYREVAHHVLDASAEPDAVLAQAVEALTVG